MCNSVMGMKSDNDSDDDGEQKGGVAGRIAEVEDEMEGSSDSIEKLFTGVSIKKIMSEEVSKYKDELQTLHQRCYLLEKETLKQGEENIKTKNALISQNESLQQVNNRVYTLEQENILLKQRMNLLENKESYFTTIKRYVPNPFNYYGFLGASVALTFVLTDCATDGIQFKETSPSAIGKSLAIIAACGYLFSHMGKFVQQKFGPKIKDDKTINREFALPVIFSIFGAILGSAQPNIIYPQSEKNLFAGLVVGTTSVFTAICVERLPIKCSGGK